MRGDDRGEVGRFGSGCCRRVVGEAWREGSGVFTVVQEKFWGSERGSGFTPSKILGEIFQRYLRKFWRLGGGAMRNFTMKFFESEQKRGVDWYGGIDLRTYTGKWPGPAQVRSEAPRSPRRATPRTAASPPPFHVEPLTHVSLRIHPDGPADGGLGRLGARGPVGRPLRRQRKQERPRPGEAEGV